MRAVVQLEGDGLIDAAEVARKLGVSRDYVYSHADEFGVIRLGKGPKPRLRFDPVILGEQLSASAVRSCLPSQRRRSGSVRSTRSGNLLPIKGE